MAIRHVALRYLVGFQCRGGECEDNCCHDWSIAFDRAHYEALARQMGRDPEEKERFRRGLLLAPAKKRRPDKHAVARLTEAGDCSFLDEQRLCSLHARYGEALLPDACAIYPRVLAADGERHELSAELSCPEVARRCLLAGDGTDLTPCTPELGGRATVGQRASDRDPPYLRYNGAIRGALYRLFSRSRYSVDERLFFLACFALESREHFTQKMTQLDGARLGRELKLLEDEEALDKLRAHFATLDGAPELTTSLVAGMLASWLSQHCAPRFRQLTRAALESLASDGGVGAMSDEARQTMQVDPAWLTEAYRARQDERRPLVAARLDAIVSNYCRHFVIRHWYTAAPDLMAYTLELLLRVAMARLLIYCQPEVESDVDGAAVDVFYALTRALEHNVGLLRAVTATLRDELPSLMHAVALIKL
jgi:lysine-N-methylase